MGTEEKVTKNEIRPIVMSVTVVLFIALLAAIVINADAFYDFLYNAVMNNAMWGLGWFSSVVCLVMVIFCVVVMVTPLGKVKLGGPNAKPKFTMMQWFGISLCTGIGAGVVFWGAAEPLIFAMDMPAYTGIESGSNAAVLWSMERCFLQHVHGEGCKYIYTERYRKPSVSLSKSRFGRRANPGGRLTEGIKRIARHNKTMYGVLRMAQAALRQGPGYALRNRKAFF